MLRALVNDFLTVSYREAGADKLGPPIRVLPGLETAGGAPPPSVSLSMLLADKESKEPPKVAKEATEKSSELMFINEGIPPIPRKVVQKIEKGDFVDLSDLLPKMPNMEEPSIAELAKDGIVVVTQTQGVKC